jgi:hypothetical protein
MKKTFDAVAFQRKARAELGRHYLENRELFLKELAEKYRDSKPLKGQRTVQTTRGQTVRKS